MGGISLGKMGDEMTATWIDISLPINTDMVHWPNNPPVSIERMQDLSRGDAADVSNLELDAHTGTHMHGWKSHQLVEDVVDISAAAAIFLVDMIWFVCRSELPEQKARRRAPSCDLLVVRKASKERHEEGDPLV
jgi:hypothetical protein